MRAMRDHDASRIQRGAWSGVTEHVPHVFDGPNVTGHGNSKKKHNTSGVRTLAMMLTKNI